MASFKILLFVAVAVACVMAEETERVKKQVVVGAVPYGAVHYGVDDGQYYPGKYETPTFGRAAVVAPAYAHAAYPYAHAAYPYAAAGAYPYVAKTVVY